jgi:hypothetical protein
MSYPINYPTPQGANIQYFYGSSKALTGNNTRTVKDWVKPQGASFVWFTLIGGGGSGDIAPSGGGSGAVTNCMVPAFLIPDVLQVSVGSGGFFDGIGGAGTNGTDTQIIYQQKDGTGYTLLTASGGAGGGAGGSATASNYFSCMGFYQSIAGQAGSTGTQTASTTTFLSGGGVGVPTTANYGYKGNPSGFFQMQPIIVGVGGTNNLAGGSLVGGIGCGGGTDGTVPYPGGSGLVVIITW